MTPETDYAVYISDITRESYTFHHVDVWNIHRSVRSRSEEPAENTRSLSALLSGQNLKGTVVFIWPDVPYSRCVTVPHTSHEAAAETAGLTHSYIFPTAEIILANDWQSHERKHTLLPLYDGKSDGFSPQIKLRRWPSRLETVCNDTLWHEKSMRWNAFAITSIGSR